MAESSRKLAAIVFTDIVGFTELSAKNEPAALQLLETQRTLLQPIVKSHNGDWLKEIGDGLLLSFPTSHEAVMCSIDIQKTVNKVDSLNLRIGIHQGEVVIQGNDVVGDDVNIAARIEPFSAPGGIAISDRVNVGLERDPDFETSFIGKPALKGVKQDVKVYCITSHGLPATDLSQVSAKLEPKKSFAKRLILPLAGVVFTLIGAFVWFIFPLISFSTASSNDYEKKIAVLYFDNKGETSDDYISEGLTQEIITRLSKIKTLSVASRYDIAGYNSSSIDLDEIKNKLNINFLLTGFIRKIDKRLKISAELIDLESRQISWAETYDKNVDDIFDIQTEVSLNVVKNLDIELNSSDEQSLLLAPAKDNEVYDMLLKLKHNAYNVNADSIGLQKIIDELDTIIEMDSTFADAIATRAFTRFLLFYEKTKRGSLVDDKTNNFYNKMIKDANTALYYDPDNFVATSIHPFLNLIKLAQSSSSTEMIFLARQVLVGVNEMIEKNPNQYLSQFVKGMYHQVRAYTGIIKNKNDYPDAVNFLNKSISQTRNGVENNIADPMVKMIYSRSMWWLAELHRSEGYHSDSRMLYEEIINLHGNDNTSWRLKKTLRRKGWTLVGMGYFEKSLDNYIKLNKISGDDMFYENSLSFFSISQLAHSYIRLNQFQVGVDILIENPPTNYYDDWDESKHYLARYYELFLGEAYAGLDNYEKSNFHLLRSIAGMEKKIDLLNNQDPNFKYPGTNVKELVQEFRMYSFLPKSIIALNNSFSKNQKIAKELADEIIEEMKIYGKPRDTFLYFKILSNLAKVYQNIDENINFKNTLDKAKLIKLQIAEKLNQQDQVVFKENVPSNIKLRSLFNLN